MTIQEDVKHASKQLTIVGKIFLIPLFCVSRAVAHISKKADSWLLAIGRFFKKLMFKE